MLWFNPFAAQYDVICGASDGYGGWCTRLNTMTRGAITVGSGGAGGSILQPPGGGFGTGGFGIAPDGGAAMDKATLEKMRAIQDSTVLNPVGDLGVNGVGLGATEPQPFGIRRDTFWPRSLQAWGVMSVIFILASIQLVSPTRRWRFLRRPSRSSA
jgi:hypothetical protein